MNDRDLLALIHDKAANYLARQKVFPLPDEIEEIWNLTKDAFDQVHGPGGDDGRDFTPPYEP